MSRLRDLGKAKWRVTRDSHLWLPHPGPVRTGSLLSDRAE
jgi:hypothetical protein